MRLLLALCFIGLTFAYRAADLIEETHHNEESLKEFQKKLQHLGEIEGQIWRKKHGGPKIGKRPIPSTVNLTQDVQSKPDQLPFLFEGDIVLTDKQMNRILTQAENKLQGTPTRPKRSMTNDLTERWSFPIPFYISQNTGVDVNAVLAGVNKWQQETCVTFQQLNYLPNGNCLNFILGQGCYSYIGRTDYGPQTVSIGDGCTSLGTVTHEIGHALGFYHEQSRWDRDNYVNIVTQNIQNIYLSQFTSVAESLLVDYGNPYDYGSVMHYDQYAFSDDNLQTIQTLDPNYQNTIGQRVAPSFADVKQINFAYCNSSCANALPCQNGGYTDPKNCQQCRCPDGLGGTLCDRAAQGDPGCSAGNLIATAELQTIQSNGAINCPFVITAPPGKKVYYQVGAFSFTNWPPCTYDYLEIKYKSNLELTGARFCTNYPTNSLSETNKVIILYHGSANSGFSLSYRYDPPTPVTIPVPTTGTTTTTTPTPTSTPSIFTFFPQPATTPFGAWTFFPQNSTPNPLCTVWSACTALCGACGTRTRDCNGQLQTEYCNTTPCSDGLCCLPFYNSNGKCKKLY